MKDKALNERENSACGIIPILILIKIAKQLKWRPLLLHYSNSGEAEKGYKKSVTGYAAIAFTESIL